MQLESAVFHLMRRVLQDHGARWQARSPQLTKPQYAALTAIDEAPGIEQAALGRRAAIDKATLAAMLARLEQRGLVARTIDRYDRRRRVLELTDEGRRVLRETTALADEINSTALDRLSAEESDRLRQLLTKLAADETGELAPPPETPGT
ncbi:MarR family winged helix-turn-helix transcriptional regulator [Saccharopolyspora sp. 6M]|uniref:MarR family winged helix-turn-helix transcriptional regulator n=1 Tax=Saccharopolyspora sp. 6M TaxID=2877237 RepID=UPI001CD4A626|nr:MarR family transcriptional regulator [Saccharopolyspora sp. 6M]MCA1227255.1 MarR family transcriptional regulator [Saccharopolyspora sp. 6M]